MLEVKNVSKYYGQGHTRVTALDNISLALHDGEYVAIMGPSGSGKSTLVNIIGGLDSLSSGEVHLDGKRIDNRDENSLVDLRRGEIAYIFQQYHLLPSLTAIENVMLPLTFAGTRADQSTALKMLEEVGLEKRGHHRPAQLSGGEQQRVAIARALVGKPRLILADEPTGNMDRKTGAQIMALFDLLNKEGHTIITVTHDPAVAELARRLIILEDGKITEDCQTAAACS